MKQKPFFYHIFDLFTLPLERIYNAYIVKSNNVVIGKNVRINGMIWIKANNSGKIVIGNEVVINSSFRANPVGYTGKTTFWTQETGKIIIGNNVGISGTCFVSREEILVEDGVFIGGGTKIYDTDFHSLHYLERKKHNEDSDVAKKKVVIRKNAFLGAGTIVLKGVEIGENSIIGAGSVVTRSVPCNEIWAGNPAKFIRKL